MSLMFIDSNTLSDIADAIRAKTGDTNDMTPLEMPTEIASIPSGGSTILSGTSEPTSAQGEDGQIYLKYGSVESDLEYITNNSANAYIPTGENGNNYKKFVITCNIHGGGSYATPIGGRTSVTAQNLLMFFRYNGTYNAQYAVNSSDTAFYDVSAYVDKKITLTLSNEVIRVEDENGNYLEKAPANTNAFVTPPLALFNLATSATAVYGSDTACYMDLYDCKVYESGNLKKWLIPKTENGTIGMVDAVDGTFYAGIGTLTGTSRSDPLQFKPIVNAYAKIGGIWQKLIGTDIDDISA